MLPYGHARPHSRTLRLPRNNHSRVGEGLAPPGPMRSCIFINGRTKALPYRVCAMRSPTRERCGNRGTDEYLVGEAFRLPRAIRESPLRDARTLVGERCGCPHL